jgi:hypothetical protein
MFMLTDHGFTCLLETPILLSSGCNSRFGMHYQHWQDILPHYEGTMHSKREHGIYGTGTGEVNKGGKGERLLNYTFA